MTSKKILELKIERLQKKVEYLESLTGCNYGSAHVPHSSVFASKHDLEKVKLDLRIVSNGLRALQGLEKIVDLLPDLWEIETYKASPAPTKQSENFSAWVVKVKSKLSGKLGYGATVEEAIANVRKQSQ